MLDNHRHHNYGLFLLPVAVLFSLTLSGCFSSSQYAKYTDYNSQYTDYQSSSNKWHDNIQVEPNRKMVNGVMRTAFSQVGNPYRYGGNSPETGFDCSGFVKWVYSQYGVELPRISSSMAGVGTPVSRDELRPGDLVFFAHKRGISHVGIYTGNDKYIHSPRTGKSIEESELSSQNNRTRFVTARRIINNDGISAINENLKNTWVAESRQQLKESRGSTIAQKSNKKELKAKKQTEKKSAKNSKSSKKGNKKSAKAVKHTVKSGDTIYDLSKKYGVSTDDIIKANNLGKKKSQLKLGQTLVVPKKSN